MVIKQATVKGPLTLVFYLHGDDACPYMLVSLTVHWSISYVGWLLLYEASLTAAAAVLFSFFLCFEMMLKGSQA